MNGELKLCKNCKHIIKHWLFSADLSIAKCGWPGKQLDPVSGDHKFLNPIWCSVERISLQACGPSGKNWEPI